MMLPSSRTYAFWLALFRIYLGLFWLEHGLGKILARPAFGAPDGPMAQFLNTMLPHTKGPYHDFLVGYVMPNLPQFGFAVEFGELVTGTLLLLGFLTPLGALIGIVLALNYWLSKGALVGFSAYAGLDVMTAAATALCLVLPVGRFLGIDALFARRGARPKPLPATPRPTVVVTPPPGPRA
ncbi:MAG: DoxX family membrane protein [Candidatus Eremiobacteraeota bacterium]|nr:DoxX family membrane protein [Candidatus Eremiobacteraeota bacterium]